MKVLCSTAERHVKTCTTLTTRLLWLISHSKRVMTFALDANQGPANRFNTYWVWPSIVSAATATHATGHSQAKCQATPAGQAVLQQLLPGKLK